MELLRSWLQEICRLSNEIPFVHWDTGSTASGDITFHAKVFIYTHNNRYSIRATTRKDGSSYLGCGVTCRTPRAGETWKRGNDLSDGPFTRETWEKIKNDIIAYELVKVAKPVQQSAVTEAPKSLDN